MKQSDHARSAQSGYRFINRKARLKHSGDRVFHFYEHNFIRQCAKIPVWDETGLRSAKKHAQTAERECYIRQPSVQNGDMNFNHA